MHGSPDALLIPESLKVGDDLVARLKSVFSWARPILGCKGRKNPYFRMLAAGGRALVSTGSQDTMQFSTLGDRAGDERYTWTPFLNHPKAEEYTAIVTKHVPALLIPELLAEVKIGELVEGANAT